MNSDMNLVSQKRVLRRICFMCCLFGLIAAGLYALFDSRGLFSGEALDYSDEGKERFWRLTVLPLQEALSNGNSPYACLNQRMNVLAERIAVKFKRYPEVVAISSYHPLSTNIIISSAMVDGVPMVRVSIPAAMDQYSKLKGSRPGWRSDFEVLFMVGLLHQVEYFMAPDPDQFAFDSLVANADFAWANTCKYSLVPLEGEGVRLPVLLDRYYKKWIECGSQTNAAWRAFIVKEHEAFREDREPR